jgi:hypothetical protein
MGCRQNSIDKIAAEVLDLNCKAFVNGSRE